MARVEIKIDGLKTREVINVNYSFTRQVDPRGLPTGTVTIDGITATLTSLEGEGTTEFPEWMCSIFKPKKGEINFYKSEERQLLKTLTFEHTYLVSYREVYDEKMGLVEEIVLSPKKVKIGEAELEENWGNAIGG